MASDHSGQLSSRIGIRHDIGGDDTEWLDGATGMMLSSMWPNAPQEVHLLAQESARQPGHLRRLMKQLRIAIRLAENPAWRNKQAAAFVQARTMIGTPEEE